MNKKLKFITWMSFSVRSLAFLTEEPEKKKSFWDYPLNKPKRSSYCIPHNQVTPDKFIDINDDFILFYYCEWKYVKYINLFIERGYVVVYNAKTISADRDLPSIILMNLAVIDRTNPLELAIFYDRRFNLFHDFSIYFTYKELYKLRIEEKRTSTICIIPK